MTATGEVDACGSPTERDPARGPDAGGGASPVERGLAANGRLDRLERRAVVASVVAVLVPIAVAAGRAVAGDWRPIGDNAYFSLRARDVLTEHHPLVGTWTSASLSFGTDVNNPSPLLFDWLALPARLDPYAGVAVAVAALNVAAVVLAAVFAWRLGGRLALAGTMAAAALVAWSMGSEVLVEPWQPHSLLLPSLAFLVLVWALACGHLVALPWAAGVASLIVGTHLSYALVVPAALAVGVAGLVLHRDRRGGLDGAEGSPSGPAPGGLGRPRRAPRPARVAAATAVVLALCWVQPVVEQVTADGDGNLTALLGNAGGADTAVGSGTATRLVAAGALTPPWDARAAFSATYRERQPRDGAPGTVPALERVPSGRTALAGLVLLGVALAAAGARSARSRDRPGAAAVAIAAVVLATGWASTARMPVNPALPLGQHQMRWIFPVAAFAVLALVVAATGRWRRAPMALAAVALVLGVLNLPAHNAQTGPVLDLGALPTVRSLTAQLAEADIEGPVLLDLAGIRFAEPYTTPVMLQLQILGIAFVTDDAAQAAQIGTSRLVTDPSQAATRMAFADGRRALADRPGARRVAFVEGLEPDEVDELSDLEATVRAELAADGLTLSGAGRRAVELGALEHRGDGIGLGDDDIERLVGGRGLVVAVRSGLLETATVSEVQARWVDLAHRWERGTATVWVEPIGDDR